MASEPLKLRLLILNNINNTDICYKVLAIETVKLKKDPEVKSQNFEQKDTNAKHSLHSHILFLQNFILTGWKCSNVMLMSFMSQ